MSNKNVVLRFYDEVFNGWDLTNLDEMMKDDYKQHSPGVKDGKEGFREFITAFVSKKPHAEIVKAVEEEDMVCIFFKVSFDDGTGTIAKVFDLYRLEDGKLAEHWDCTARVDNVETASGRGHF